MITPLTQKTFHNNFSSPSLHCFQQNKDMFNSTCEKSVLQIKQDDKFFSRLLSKENSNCHPSFRVSVAVPFVWESQPGTPKHTFPKDIIPPLTPPPSYHFNNANKKNEKKHSKSSKYLLALFQKLNFRKNNQSSSSSSASSLSSSYPSFSLSSIDSSKITSGTTRVSRRRFLSFGSSFDFRGENEDGNGNDSPTSTLCFGIHRSISSNSGFQSNYKRRVR